MISLHFNFKFIINFRTWKSNWWVPVYRHLRSSHYVFFISINLDFKCYSESQKRLTYFLMLYWILWFKIKIILIIWMVLLMADTCQVLILLLGAIVNVLHRLTSALKTLITVMLSIKLGLPWVQMSPHWVGFLNVKHKYSSSYELNGVHSTFLC